MKLFFFALLVIAGLIGGLVVGSTKQKGSAAIPGYTSDSRVADTDAMIQYGVGGTIAGVVVAGIGFWLTSDKKKGD
jgi:hypothetical protein